MSLLTIHLFGKFQLQRGEQIVENLPRGKMQELFCYLLLHRNELHSREMLASLLWPNCTTEKSRKYLRQALWQLKNMLNSALQASNIQVLLADAESVHVNGDDFVWVDVTAFEKACQLAKGRSGEQLNASLANELDQAVRLYRGDLLEGCYQDWCLYERERLQNCYLSALDKLICYYLKTNDYVRAIEYGEHVLRTDRAHERTHQQLMRLHYKNGDRTAALHQYQRCVVALREELAVEPSLQTQKLYEQLRGDQVDAPVTPATAAPEPASSHEYLHSLLRFIGRIEFQIRKRIQAGR